MSGKSYLPVLGDRGCPARHRLILPLRCPGGLAPTSPARWVLAVPGGGLNSSGTCSPCPGGEDHLKRRSSSPPVPLSLAAGTANRKAVLSVLHRTGDAENESPAGAGLAGRASVASGSVQGCRGRSPRRNKLLVSPFPAGEGGRWDRGQESKLKAGGNRRQSGQAPPRRAQQRKAL